MKPRSIYQLFVRDCGNGTFSDAEKELGRIRDMGFTTVYLLPIHPIGSKGRKGTIGSPYAIRDYNAVDDLLGGVRGFRRFLDHAHQEGLEVMMDIVIHHTARDHRWVSEHPEYYMHDENGGFLIAVEEWSDIYDLDFSCDALKQELIAMMKYWAEFGVDGFRCDVASLVPFSFWKQAVQEVRAINPDFVWLAESVNQELIPVIRSKGLEAMGDGETAQLFDMLYPYDVWTWMMKAVKDKDLKMFQVLLNFSLSEYRSGMRKVWCLENHDRARLAAIVQDPCARKNWLAWSFLMLGTAFVYAGQEYELTKTPSLFEREPVLFPKETTDAMMTIQTLNMLRSRYMHDLYAVKTYENEDAMEFVEYGKERSFFGCFNVKGLMQDISVPLADGFYTNEISGKEVRIENGHIPSADCPFFTVLTDIAGVNV